MFQLTKNNKKVLLVVVVASLCLVFSALLPTIHSQASGFTLPCTITTTGNAWDGYIAFDLELQPNYVGAGSNNSYLVVMDTNGTVLSIRQSSTSYGVVYNISPDTLMFQGEPVVDGANTAPTFATHFWNLTSGATQDFPNVISEHDIQYNPINHTFLTLQQYVQQSGDNPYLIDRIVQDHEGRDQEDQIGQPVGRKKPHKAALVPINPGYSNSAVLYERVGEAESAEEDENTDTLRGSLDDCINDSFNST